MFLVRLLFSLSVALAFGWLGLWLIGAADSGYSSRLCLAGLALLAGAPAWALVTNAVLKRVLASSVGGD